jgi:phosphoenolpyruvate carboxylase
MYSLGIPPEIFGLSALDEKNLEFIDEASRGFRTDMKDALKFLNPDNLRILPDKTKEKIEKVLGFFDYEADEKHKKITSIIFDDFKKNNTAALTENIERAAAMRNFLG